MVSCPILQYARATHPFSIIILSFSKKFSGVLFFWRAGTFLASGKANGGSNSPPSHQPHSSLEMIPTKTTAPAAPRLAMNDAHSGRPGKGEWILIEDSISIVTWHMSRQFMMTSWPRHTLMRSLWNMLHSGCPSASPSSHQASKPTSSPPKISDVQLY